MNKTKLTYQILPISALSIHPDNVRNSGNQGNHIDELMASIKSVGLLTPLIVQETAEFQYGVIAGGRRLTALKNLAEAGELPTDLTDGVACRIMPKEGYSNIEVSLTENYQRTGMTAYEQITAWGKLAHDGFNVATIASRFGATESLVKQRLALANVIPEVLELLRDEQITIDTVKAFTLAEDQEHQRAVLTECDGNVQQWRVRKLLTSDTLTADDKRVKLVGLDAYIAAGGKLTRDLFDEGGTLIHDADLLGRMADDCIEAKRMELIEEGWKWVKLDDDDAYGSRYTKYRQLHPTPGEPTDDEFKRMNEIQALLDSEDEQPDETALADEYQEIEERIENRAIWDDEIKAEAGVFMHLDWHGNIVVSMGWVSRKDESKKNAESAGFKDDAKPAPIYSNALKEMVGKSRTQIVRAALTNATGLCADIVAFNLAMNVAIRHPQAIGTIGFSKWDAIGEPDSNLPCYAELDAFRNGLDRTWLEPDDWTECFALFRQLPREAKQAWICYSVAMSISVNASNNMPDATLESIITELDIEWANQYRPGDEFFLRMRKQAMLEMMRPVLGDQWVQTHTGEKKSVLVDILSEIAAGTRSSLTADQKAAVAGWVPEGFLPKMPDGDAEMAGDTQDADADDNEHAADLPKVA